ncbi:HigA family addiction module antidote protein [candidate division KSB1 bacterium]|nr:HigA family addiction module antidote protein [candidate division KSB1 bacterium]
MNPMLPQYRQPTHPGEIIRYEFLEPLQLTQQELAEAIGVTRVRINEIILGKRSVTPDTAFRLAKFFDTTPDFWIGLQTNYDMWETLQSNKSAYAQINPLKKKVA